MISRRRAALVGLFVVVLSLALSGLSHAAWPHHPAINVPVCAQTGAQMLPVAVPDGAGGAIVAWEDWRDGNADIFAQHVLATGGNDPAWPAAGLMVCQLPSEHERPRIISDGAGGAIVAWQDKRTGLNFDIFAQRVLASGVCDPAWPVCGRAICNAASDQAAPELSPDGAGGAIVSWYDYRGGGADIYAQHVSSGGIVDPAWPVDGRALCTAVSEQYLPLVVTDGAGGAIAAWYDFRGPSVDFYAQHVRANGTVDPGWTADGRPLCLAAGTQNELLAMPDGFGGALYFWSDFRGVDYDLYAQHVMASGSLSYAFQTDGNLVCGASGNQVALKIVSDDAGGAIVAWQDARNSPFDIYATHFTPAGGPDPAWTANGVMVSDANSSQHVASIVSDGAGGAIIAGHDFRDGLNADVYAHHVQSSGALGTGWPADGRAVCVAGLDQINIASVPDGSGGAILLWEDRRAGDADIYSQRVSAFGYLGDPEPVIASVRDVPNDQGGKVKLSWFASYLDLESAPVVDHYWIFRSVPPGEATFASAPTREDAADSRALATSEMADRLHIATTEFWEFVTSQTAYHLNAGYSLLAPTASDSAATYNPPTQFMVVALNAAGDQYWYSDPDSGYSADNIPPVTPAPFTGNYSAGATRLHWNPNAEPDLEGYRIYRGGSAGFTPSPGNLIASPPDTGYADVGVAGSFYKLSAMDVHGNESGFALLTPSSTSGVETDASLDISFARPMPNPASEFALLRYTLPAESRVKLALFDLSGRLVRALVRGVVPAGEHAARWDLANASGSRVAPGLYIARLDVNGRALSRPLVVVR